jgi:hypothetical protein
MKTTITALAKYQNMKLHLLKYVGIAFIGCFFCASGYAQERADIDVEFSLERKATGELSHKRNTKDLVTNPLVHTWTGLDGRSHIVSISYVGYAGFRVAKGAKKNGDQLSPGHVFAVQVVSGKKGVTIETAEENMTKLIVFTQSPQTLYEDKDISVTIRNQK